MLNVQNLSDAENKLVDQADKKLLAKLKETKDVKRSPKDTLKSQIDKMREHQKLMMDTFQVEKPKVKPVITQIETRNENETSIDETIKPEEAQKLIKQPQLMNKE